MTQTLISVGLFVVVLAMIPLGLKWLQRNSAGGVAGISSATRIVSAVAVGPHQRVVTIEIGPDGSRSLLTLGVTAQSITCLHSSEVPVKAPVADANDAQSPGVA
jgi:flagellar protein FliO/FliZ